MPVAAIIGSANNHDSTKFIGVMESISDHLDTGKVKSVYADKGYGSDGIRECLKSKNIIPCIPKRDSSARRGIINHDNNSNYNKTRFVVERFFAWLKNGFHRTTIRYERKSENYLGFVYLASILMYWRVLG